MKYTLIILFVFLTACSGTANLPKDRAAATTPKVPYSIQDVKIVDLRADVSAADWRLPLFATKADEQTIHPAIEGELRQSLLGMIKDAGSEGMKRANATLYIDEAYYRVTGDWKSVSEYTSFRCRLEMTETDGGNTHLSQTELSYEYNSIKASEKHVKRLFELTARNAVFDALGELGDIN